MKKIENIILLVIFILLALPAVAQPGPPATPIDGGLGLLLAGGAVYGIKKIREAKTKE